MRIQFYKYQGTGNDFVILDNRKNEYNSLTNKQIQFLCDRHMGIGADGLMMLNGKEGYDFEMKYYNADGNEGSMCGNGGRCLVKFAYDLGIHKSKYIFSASDGDHEAEIDFDGAVSLKMKDVKEIKPFQDDFILNTGSPHYIRMVEDIGKIHVVNEGRAIRNSEPFREEGINVNFVQHKADDEIGVCTYERGVEDETLSCGTGVTAAALTCFHNESGFNDVVVHTKGGKLNVEYDRDNDGSFKNIWLTGPVKKVFEGSLEL